MNDKAFSGKVLEEINMHSPGLLKNYDDIRLILELSKEQKSDINFNELMFNAKYIKGLRTVLSKISINGDVYQEKIFNEFTKNLEMFSSQIKSLLNNSDDALAQFEKKYFEMEHECMANLMSLIDDLSCCKEFYNRSEAN